MTESSNRSPDRPLRKPGTSRGRREVVFDGDPPRPMTALTRSILERKRQMARPVPPNLNNCGDMEAASAFVLSTADGKLSYALRNLRPGLQVERTSFGSASLHVSQILFFADPQAFELWCDTEPTRFKQPVLHQQLRQEGLRLLNGRATAPDTN
jgi:hypothetical protein